MGLFSSRKKDKEKAHHEIEGIKSDECVLIDNSPDCSLTVVLESLPSISNADNEALVEITDAKIIARVDSMLPSLGSAGTAIGNIVNYSRVSTDTLYKVVLKHGGELVDSTSLAGAKRAMTMGANGIKEQANLVEVSTKVSSVANAGAAAMNVASMVVGQYYMQQIDAKVAALNDSISKVVDFLDVQYKSQVASLIESVFTISKYQISSMSNEEIRRRELDNIQALRKDCQVLLNQAESALEGLLSKECKAYSDYQKQSKEIEKWHQYQDILLKVLFEINSLDFTLHLGIKTNEQCFGTFPVHTDKLKKTHALLVSWHDKQCEKLKISLTEGIRKNTGLLGYLEKPISKINDEWNYQPLDNDTVALIQGQIADIPELEYKKDNPFDSDVEIVIKDGKKYYLPKK